MVKSRPIDAARRAANAVEAAKPLSAVRSVAVVHPKPLQGRSRAELSREVRFALDAFATQGTSTVRRPRLTEGRGVPFICG